MLNNPNNTSVPEANTMNGNTLMMDIGKSDGLKEAKKQGKSVKIAFLLVILLILSILIAYILMKYMRKEEEPENLLPTTVPTIVASIAVDEPSVTPIESNLGYDDFSFSVFIPDNKDNPYIISGRVLNDAKLTTIENVESAGFAVNGEGYQLNVSAFYESETIAYEEFLLLDEIGDEKIGRINDYSFTSENQYTYVRSHSVSEKEDCQALGLDLISAPCGPNRYTSGNEVESFYILSITCDSDVNNVTKCDDIVKSLDIQY